MTVRVRPHHLLCLLTYAGKGYSAAFTANFDGIAARLAQGEDVLIVEGPDDICAPLRDDAEAHCWRDGVRERDRLAARDLAKFLESPIQAGSRLTLAPASLRDMRRAFAAGRSRAACLGCEWSDLCTAIAASDYGGTVIANASPAAARA